MHPELCERVILSILLFLVVFAPLAYGAVEPWARNVVLLSIGSMACVWLWRFVSLGRPKLSFPPFFPAAVLFLVLIALQLVPLPGALKDFLTPDRLSLVTAPAGPASWGRLTANPGNTAIGALFVAACLAFCFVLLNTFRHQKMGQDHADCSADAGKSGGSLRIGRILDRTTAYFLVSEDLLS